MVVARPRRVARAERVELGLGDRETALGVLRLGAQLEVAAFLQRQRQRHRLAPRFRVPRADVGDLLLGVPGVEAAALGAARADPLHVLHGDGDVGVRHVGALGRERHERGVHPRRLIDEVGQLDADVDRGRVHADRGAVGDPLPRHVGDLALDLVVVADAVAARRLELDLEAAVRRRSGPRPRAARCGRSTAAGRRRRSRPAGSCGAATTARRRPRVRVIRPAHRRALHRRPEQVAGGHAAGQRRAGERRGAGQRGVDAEVGPAVGRHEEAAADRVARLRCRSARSRPRSRRSAAAPAPSRASSSAVVNGRSRISTE